jgi:hypothetical protein
LLTIHPFIVLLMIKEVPVWSLEERQH